MKRLAILIAVPLVIFATAAVAQRQWIVGPPRAGGGTAVYFDDDTVIGFGNTSAAPDAWCGWFTDGTDRWGCVATDVNGAGLNGSLFSFDTGTDDAVFVGNVSTVAGTISAEQLTSTDDATVTDNLSCGDATITEAAGGLHFSGATSNGITITAADLDLPTSDLNGNDILNLDDAYSTPAATAATPARVGVSVSQGPNQSIAAAENDGADDVWAAATGANDLTGVTKANTAGDTLTFSGTTLAGVAYSVTITEGDGTLGTYECNGAADDATCVANLIACVAANATLGSIVTAVTRVGETTAFFPTTGAAATLRVVPSDGTNTVIVRGTDGNLHARAPYFYVGTAAQGARFDTTSTGVLKIATESAGNITVQALRFYATIFSGTVGGDTSLGTLATSSAAASGSVSVASGPQNNAGDYASGALNLYTGATTTDGNTGAVNIYTGAAGAGTADAGNVVFAVNGAPGSGTTAMTIAGNGGGVTFNTFGTSSSYLSASTYVSAGSYLSAGTYAASTDLALTAASGGTTGNATLSNNGYLRTATSKMAITHAAFDTACDTLTTCNYKMVTLPARTIVNRAYFVVDIAETHITPVTVSCGDTAAGYVDYILAATTTAQTIYGDAVAEQGASLASGASHIHSTSATTDVYCQFVEADGSHDLGDSESFAGWLVLETSLMP
jgi:hypothetical protein